jgi:hypothetical protein
VIHDIARALQAKLRSKGFASAEVKDGAETTQAASWGRERLVLEHDGADRFGAAKKGQHWNPSQLRVRQVSAKLTIYAQSPKAGALPFEHIQRAEKILDLALVAFDEIAAATSPPPVYNVWSPTSGRFLTPPALEGTERQGGAVYELTLAFERGVFDRDFAGDAAEEATVGGEDGVGITTTRRVSIDGSDQYETV